MIGKLPDLTLILIVYFPATYSQTHMDLIQINVSLNFKHVSVQLATFLLKKTFSHVKYHKL